MGYFNTIWLADANAMALQALEHATSPPLVLNITGEMQSARSVCEHFGRLFGKAPQFSGQAADTALLSNSTKAFSLFGMPRIKADQMIEWVAQWVQSSGAVLNKPTHFESRDGRF
jgi:hypothetical protein